MDISRRDFLVWTAAVGGVVLGPKLELWALEPVDVPNPLEHYPARGWEQVYRDQYKYDSTFTWICSPNCTHECRMLAVVRNGVFLRAEQNYDNGRIGDLYGNKATANWNPRGCSNGYTFQRRVYGPHRLRYPIVRKGWKRWADEGFPDLTPEKRSSYKFDSRGTDEFVRVSWDEAFDYVARGLIAIARRYSGEEGKKRLLEQGVQPETLLHWEGAGTRTFKLRGGMGATGFLGKYGMYRNANLMALLDHHVRHVPKHDDCKGARIWSNYTWHGDQAPGHPFVHGLQAADCDMNDMRFSKLHIQMGKNLIENKRADNHFFVESMERGAKIVVVSPEYSPPATKADYWIPIRPMTDTALLLGITKLLMDQKKYDAAFVKKFTDFPLLVRTDTLKRLTAADVIKGHEPFDLVSGPSGKYHGFTKEQRARIPDYVVWDAKTRKPVAISRDDVGETLAKRDIDPALEGRFKVELVSGVTIEVMPLFEAYKQHLADYDLDSVCEITHAPKELIQRLTDDIATTRPVAIHQGEGINHWFHATEANRASYLPLMLTGNIGARGAGSYTWAGNYKAALFQGSPATGPGFKGWVAEDPFEPVLDPKADGKDIHAHAYTKDEEPAYWNYSERALVVDTPKYGRKSFTGKTHMPTPTRAMWFTNVNLINNAKWAYEMIKNVDPMVEMIVSNDIEMTGSIEYADIALAANSWVEAQTIEVTGSCSNPFLQLWKGGLAPVYDTKDDLKILAGVAKKMGDILEDKRFAEYWKFALEDQAEVYAQRLLDSSTTTRGYKVADIMAGKYGEPGSALFLFRTYPRIPFYEQIQDSIPFHTPTGRLQSYNDEPEVIEYGENFIVHREGPEATPYLPNVIVTSNPLVRPDDYGIPESHMGADERSIRNVKKPWSDVKKTKNPLWEKGYRFLCLTPKSRHSTHSSWFVVDWHSIWSSQNGDPYRMDRRMPGVGENSCHMNPQAAKDLGISDGDYVYVDANPLDRPYQNARPDDPFYRVARLMLRVRYNPAYPYGVIMMKHGAWLASERTVKAHETREDGRAVAEGTNYISNYRYGSHQSITRGWLPPMHQLDSLFHKSKIFPTMMFGGEADNHAVNTVPKETLVKVTKAEDGGLGGRGVWKPATVGMSPSAEDEFMKKYLSGGVVRCEKQG